MSTVFIEAMNTVGFGTTRDAYTGDGDFQGTRRSSLFLQAVVCCHFPSWLNQFKIEFMKRDSWFIPFVVILTILLSVVILFDLSPLVRGPKQWRWSLLPQPEPKLILLTIIAFVLFLVIWYWIGRRLPGQPSRRYAWTIRSLLYLAALLIQLSILLLFRANPADILFERSASDIASGYFTAAQEIEDLPDFLREYPEHMTSFYFSGHVRTKPPGIVLIYWGSNQIMKSLPMLAKPFGDWASDIKTGDDRFLNMSDQILAGNALVSLVLPLISALIIWPAYAIASRRWGALAGWIAAGLVVLIPARLVFFPLFDTVYPFLSLLAFYLADTGLRHRQSAWFLAAGFIISVMSFMSPTTFGVAALVGAYAIVLTLHEEKESHSKRLLAKQLALLALGVFSIWLLYWLLFGVSLFDISQAIREHDITEGRGYWFWLLGNLVDFFILAGLPVMILAPSWPFLNKHSKFPKGIVSMAIAFWIVLLLLDFSGLTRAETGRIWLLLAPYPAIMAAVWLQYVTFEPDVNQSVLRNRMLSGGLWIVMATALLAWAIALRWHVIALEW